MRIIDLTLELEDDMSTHPAHPRCVVIEFAQHAGHGAALSASVSGVRFARPDVLGSHRNPRGRTVPLHPDGGTIESMPLEQLIGPAVWLDFSDKRADEPITPAMLDAACAKAGIHGGAGRHPALPCLAGPPHR